MNRTPLDTRGLGSITSQAPLTKKNSEIDDCMDSLAATINSLGSAIKGLEDRLDPVLAPPTPQGQSEAPSGKQSKLGNAIQDKAIELVALRSIVEQLIHRLTV